MESCWSVRRASSLRLIGAGPRRCPLIYYTPVTLLLFSFVQYQNTLWGFQMAWYLVTLALALVLFLLDRPALSWWVFAAAIAAAVVGSFSSLQGLLIWPVGLLILCARHRQRHSLVIWIACALAAITLYFHNLNSFYYSDQTYVFTHPIESLKYFFFLVGSVLGVQLTPSPWPIIVYGAIVTVIAIWLVVKHQWRSEGNTSLVGVSLICYGVLFAATITQGRAWFGLWGPSRYATCGLLILTGCYLAALDRTPARNGYSSLVATAEDRPERRSLTGIIMWACLTGTICLQLVLGTGHGLASAKPWSQSQKETADIIVNADKSSNALLRSHLHEGFTLPETRQLVQMMKENRLNLFGTSAESYYSHIGLLPEYTALRVQVAYPARGATIKGTAVLGAGASDLSGVIKVYFSVRSDDGRHDTLIGTRRSPYGWLAFFNTSEYPNGNYELRSVAYGFGGKKSYSPSIRVSVKNGP